MGQAAQNADGLHWREDGDPTGLALVFANSLGTDLHLWDAVLARLPDGLRIIRYDKPGHGASPAPQEPVSIDSLAEDTERLLHHLNVHRCVFVGLSIGGMIGQVLAARRPDLIQAAILSNTAATMGAPALWHDRIRDVQAGGMERIAKAVLQRWFAPDFDDPQVLEAARQWLGGTSVAGYIACCQAIAAADLQAKSSQISCPVLVVTGSADQACPPAHSTAFAQSLAQARLRVMAGIGHLPCLEAPERFAQLIIQFLKENGHA